MLFTKTPKVVQFPLCTVHKQDKGWRLETGGGKVDRYLERTYHAGRLSTPSRRVAAQRRICAAHLGVGPGRDLGKQHAPRNLHLWPFVPAARKQGVRVIVVAPANTRTARAADKWIPIRPGADGALGLAIMQVIIAEARRDVD